MNKIGFLLDMDGVIYRGNQLIPGADVFINGLRERGIPYLFLTNNSQRTRRDVAHKLRKLGVARRFSAMPLHINLTMGITVFRSDCKMLK